MMNRSPQSQKKNTGTPASEGFALPAITVPLLAWYDSSRRVLPWREDPAPYHVWLSEIMLQQTRVETVIPYYERFLAELPDVAALAAAPEDRLLKLWEGLGYYSRVRNLQKAARQVMDQYDGSLPADPRSLQKLTGIGPYTAAAIASIAFRVPVPSVDGNLLRVFARLTGYGENILAPAAKKLAEPAFSAVLPQDRPGDMNQALMDLGATVCLPNGAPLCEKCPLAGLCKARLAGLTDRLPAVEKKPARRVEKRTVLVIRTKEACGCPPEGPALPDPMGVVPGEELVLLQKRPAKGLLAGLWEFPNPEGRLSDDEVSAWCSARQLAVSSIRPLSPARHVFTHLEWDMTGYEIWANLKGEKTDGLFVPVRLLFSDYALPSAFTAFAALLK